MKTRSVIEIETDTYEEEQYILTKIPDAKWLKIGEKTRFYVSINQIDYVEKVINEWNTEKIKRSEK